MPLLRPLEYLYGRTHGWPRLVRYSCTLGLVGVAFAARLAAGAWMNETAIPFLFFWPAVLGSAAAFANGAGYLAAAASAVASVYFLPPVGVFAMPGGTALFSLGMFTACGALTAGTVETLHHAIRDQHAALEAAREATRRRGLLLVEYRHRSRGDLQSVSSLLRLRARYVDSEAAKAALREAAEHTVALGRIHARLEHARHDADEVAVVNSGCFIRGVCADLMPPVTTVAAAVSQPLSTERSVSVGLLLVELVAAARRDRAGRVDVRLTVAGDDTFILDVIDDRAAEGETDGLRARLVGLLAVQLRGTVTRVANRAGPGLAVCVRFPVLAPVLAPGAVGA
jgi:two-component sensor histidine kinase